MKYLISAAVVVGGLLSAYPDANAAFHLWEINEFYSNSDGTVQFVELATSSPTEQQLSGHTMVSTSPGKSPVVFTFDANLSGSTENRQLLLATERFALLTGVVPDFVLPEGFLATREGTINFAEGADVLTYATGQFPVNGTQSLNGEGQPQVPTPTRLDGTMASLPEQVLPYARIDLETSQLEIPVLDAPGLGVFHLVMSIDFNSLTFQPLSFFPYDEGIAPGALPATFDGRLTIPSLEFQANLYRVRLSIVQDPPLVFGDIEILDVTPVVPDPDPEPEPEPDPEPDPLEESISRGVTIYANQCATCHGVDGSGTSQGPSLDFAVNLGFEQLRSFINNSMPFGNAGSCTDNGNASCATDAANFIRNRL